MNQQNQTYFQRNLKTRQEQFKNNNYPNLNYSDNQTEVDEDQCHCDDLTDQIQIVYNNINQQFGQKIQELKQLKKSTLESRIQFKKLYYLYSSKEAYSPYIQQTIASFFLYKLQKIMDKKPFKLQCCHLFIQMCWQKIRAIQQLKAIYRPQRQNAFLRLSLIKKHKISTSEVLEQQFKKFLNRIT